MADQEAPGQFCHDGISCFANSIVVQANGPLQPIQSTTTPSYDRARTVVEWWKHSKWNQRQTMGS